MVGIAAPQSNFESAFESSFSELAAIWPGEFRRRAMMRFAEMGFPTTKDEEWRFTSVREIAESDFDFSAPEQRNNDIPASAGRDAEFRLVFANGVYMPAMSRLPNVRGVTVTNLADAIERHGADIGEAISDLDASFLALNTALFRDGYFIAVEPGVVLDTLIYCVFISDGNAFSAPRNIITVGENAQAKVVESYVCYGKSFVNAVSEAHIHDSAMLEHVKLQLGSEDAYHITTQEWKQERASSARTTTVTLGGKLVRNDTNSALQGEGAECTINGLYVCRGRQHVDNHTKLDHRSPHCPSHELFKGILDGKSSAVFNGKIVVRQPAQKTDSKQSNMNLLLSDDAVINTKPQLEIFADDVRCTHGATIGRLDKDALFYLRSRGVPESEAQNLLVYAFASDVIDRIAVPELRESLEAELFKRFAEKE